jgi:hypothetical protein
MKGAQTWMLQKENNVEWRGTVILKHILVANNDMKQHGNTLTYI